ncbi:MAG TPA: COX15/CtaA family protein, partial [Immundisolibacter sp.]|nr:COX15/CtaA family protein [Immundisolibacter sp.]
RVAVHMAHRAWAVVTFLYLGAVGIYALRQPGSLRAAAAVMLTLLLAQVSLGIANVWLHLPLPVAAAHNAVAALLLLALLTLTHTLYRSGTARG